MAEGCSEISSQVFVDVNIKKRKRLLEVAKDGQR